MVTKFKDFKYERPDLDAFESTVDELLGSSIEAKMLKIKSKSSIN